MMSAFVFAILPGKLNTYSSRFPTPNIYAGNGYKLLGIDIYHAPIRTTLFTTRFAVAVAIACSPRILILGLLERPTRVQTVIKIITMIIIILGEIGKEDYNFDRPFSCRTAHHGMHHSRCKQRKARVALTMY